MRYIKPFLLFIAFTLNCTEKPSAVDIGSLQLIYGTGTVSDIDGNVYNTVKIGSQWWMAENLKVTCYRNGDSIPAVIGSPDWANLTSGAMCSYENDDNNIPVYGLLYNWFALNDIRGFAPDGWHVPSDEEWQILTEYLGGRGYAGGLLKEEGPAHWDSPNIDAVNFSGFSALAGGYRYDDGDFRHIGVNADFWTSTEYDSSRAWARELNSYNSIVDRGAAGKNAGFSVRCIRD